MAIYFGSHWVDEVVSLSFSVIEQIRPIYGYNSILFDAVSRGNRQVSGSFRINFRHTNYLGSLLDRLTRSDVPPDVSLEEAFFGDPTHGRLPLDMSVELPAKVTKDDIEELLRQRNTRSSVDFRKKIESYQDQVWKTPIKQAQATSWYFQGDHAFDIVIVYGLPLVPVTGGFQHEIGTVNTIKDVYILAFQQVVDADGSPVFEDYQFIARDVVRPREQS